MAKEIKATQDEVLNRRAEMSLHDVYVGSLQQKKNQAQDQLGVAIAIYEAHQQGRRSEHLATPHLLKARAQQHDALNEFVSNINATLNKGNIDRASDPEGFNAAIRSAYRNVIEKYGTETIDPTKPGGVAQYDRWFKVYNKSFPIRGERETYTDMRAGLGIPATKDEGYAEVALGLQDPLTGKYVGGVQGLVVGKAKAGMFTYAFLDPAFQGFGLSHTLLDVLRSTVNEVVTQYNPDDKRSTLILLEKNDLENMPLKNLFLDTTGFSTNHLPRVGDDLTKGAISQSYRDATWSSLGAKQIGEEPWYIQPSLDGETLVSDPKERALVIRHLQSDSSLTTQENDKAAKLVKIALEGKAEHCPLALCAFVDGDLNKVDADQVKQFMEPFLRTSCLGLGATDESFKKDIFVAAAMDKMQSLVHEGKIDLKPIVPFAGPFLVTSYPEAEEITRNLLKVVPLKEVQGSDISYGDSLHKYESQIIQLSQPAEPTVTRKISSDRALIAINL